MPYDIDFRIAQSRDHVANFLGMSETRLLEAIAAGERPFEPQAIYERHRIPKRRRGALQYREVWDVTASDIRDAHRQFARRFSGFLKSQIPGFPHPCAYGYVRGRGIKENAARHCGAEYLLHCDLSEFFFSITREALFKKFVNIGMLTASAEALASFATIQGRLALGLNASPLLANLMCFDLDTELEQMAQAERLHYSRYADDMAFSGQSRPDLSRVREIVERYGFSLADRKTRLSKRGQSHFVTGLSVSDEVGPHVPRRFKHRLRQEIYYCLKYGIRSHLEKTGAEVFQRQVNRLDGSVRFLWSIEPLIAKPLRVAWAESLRRSSITVSYEPYHRCAGMNVTMVFDESEFATSGVNCLAIGCATTERIDIHRELVATTLSNALADPFAAGDKAGLKKNGLHFGDASEDLRTSYISMLSLAPFRMYVAYGSIVSSADWASRYLTLVAELLPRRLKAYDQANVTLLFEENSKISLSALNAVVAVAYQRLVDNNDRRPINMPIVQIVTKKDEPALALVDTCLGVFRRFFEEATSDLYIKRFERLRDRFRHIVNIDSGEMWSRRHPFENRTGQTGGA